MTILLPGLTDAHEAQKAFRSMLDALANPGRRHLLPTLATTPKGLTPAAAMALLTLVDMTTPISLIGAPATMLEWIGFHTGAPAAPTEHAVFVHAPLASRPALASLRQGSLQAPETSATLLLDVPALEGGRLLRLTGPGIRDVAFVAPRLDECFVGEWMRQASAFPRGIDVFLLCGAEVIGLPRSLSIEEA